MNQDGGAAQVVQVSASASLADVRTTFSFGEAWFEVVSDQPAA